MVFLGRGGREIHATIGLLKTLAEGGQRLFVSRLDLLPETKDEAVRGVEPGSRIPYFSASAKARCSDDDSAVRWEPIQA